MTTILAKVDIGEALKLKGDRGIGDIKEFTPQSGIRGYIASILPNVFVFAGLILLALVIAGGVGMVASAGNPEAREKSRGVLTNALIGFFIILASFWIIRILQIVTGVNIIGDI